MERRSKPCHHNPSPFAAALAVLLACVTQLRPHFGCHAFSSFHQSALQRHHGKFVQQKRITPFQTPTSKARLPSERKPANVVAKLSSTSLSSSTQEHVDEELLAALRSMRVKELKSELQLLKISTHDVFEKEELVQRLYNAKTTQTDVYNGDTNNEQGGVGVNRNTSSSSREPAANNDASDPTFSSWTIAAPLHYYELESAKSVAAQNSPEVYLRPSPGKYAAIRWQFQSKSNANNQITLNLLVDTACSGIVLSPKAISRANNNNNNNNNNNAGSQPLLQTINSATATMMSAGGARGGYNVAKWEEYSTRVNVGGVDLSTVGLRDMPKVAAVQDIGALPGMLDGILGLSFLNQFACADFDFANKQLRLHKSDLDPPFPDNLLDNNGNGNTNNGENPAIIAKGPLALTRLGIYTVQTTLDGRGPVRLLVDTGAASTFLNWKGVSDMGLSKTSSPQIERNRDAIGAMGADNMALELTHRYVLKRRWNLVGNGSASGSSGSYLPGMSLRGTEFSAGINVDIGDLPVLEALRGEGVGGILGADLLMMCDLVRLRGMNGRSPTMILMKK